MSDNESKSISPNFTIDVEITNIEIATHSFVGPNFEKMNNESLAKALRELYKLLGSEDSKEGRPLINAICEALTDRDSFWRLNLTHRSEKGEAIGANKKILQLTKDVFALKVFEQQVAEGIKKEAIYAELSDFLGITVSGVRAALKRAKDRKL